MTDIGKLFLYVACIGFMACGECDQYVKAGEYPLSEKTKSILPFDNGDTVFLEDENGVLTETEVEHWRVQDRLLLREIDFTEECGSVFDYYRIDWYKYGLRKDDGLYAMDFELFTDVVRHDDLDSIVLFDKINVTCSDRVNGIFFSFNFDLLTDERINTLDDPILTENVEFLGDTTIHERVFEMCYRFCNSDNECFYMSLHNGDVHIDLGEGRYWRLK